MSQKTRRQQISRRAIFITNVVLIVIPVLVVGFLIEIGAQPAGRFRPILLGVFAVEAVIFLLPSSWLPSGGIRPMGTLITARELRTFMQENRALARDRPWGSETVAIGPAIAFVVTALSFVFAR